MALVVSDASALPFSDQSVDRILAAGLFHHVDTESAAAILGEMARVVRPTGRVVVLDAVWPRRWYNVTGLFARYLDDGKFVRFPQEYARLFSAAFEIRSLEYPSRLTLDYVLAVLETPRGA
jgi:ubiquinone/menaquinone biosynthesis C-methylase UbiE